MKRMITTLALAAAMLLATAASALAFEPPADPADTFSCEGDVVAGFPGANGQSVAVNTGDEPFDNLGAWNAHIKGNGTIGECP